MLCGEWLRLLGNLNLGDRIVKWILIVVFKYLKVFCGRLDGNVGCSVRNVMFDSSV